MQGLVRARCVAQGEIDIRVGNKARVVALEVGTMQLQLPSGFIMELNNCYSVYMNKTLCGHTLQEICQLATITIGH